MKRLALWLAPLIVIMFGAAATGQDNLAADAKIEAIDRLIVVLDDDQLRGQLLEQLRSLSSAPEAPAAENAAADGASAPAPTEEGATTPGLIDALSDWSTDLVEQLPTTTFGIPIDQKAQQAQTQLSTRIEAGIKDGQLLQFAAWSLPLLLVTALAAFALRRVGRGLTAATKPVRKRRLAAGLLLKFVAHVVLFIALASSLALFSPTEVSGSMFLTVAAGIVLAMLMTDLAVAGLSALAGMRGVRIVVYCQKRFYRWWLPILMLAILAALCRDPATRGVIGWSVADIASFALNMLAAATTLLFIMRYRPAIGRLIFGRASQRSPSDNPLVRAMRQLAKRWHLFAYAFVVLSAVSLFSGQRDNDVFTLALWSFGIVLIALVAVFSLHRLYGNLLTGRRRQRGAVRQAVIEGLFKILRVASDAAIAVVAVITIVRIWGFDLGTWLLRDGQQLTQPLAAAIVCALVSWLIWIALDAWIASALTPTDAFGRPRQRTNRAQTLLPLLRNGLMILLLALAGIAVLANIGVDVTPLIAGAGVFGLALSFGSQQLVQDVITGVFILAEDTLAIGDTVNTGDRSGVVEGISLRTVRLRDADGALHSVPFSTIKALKNSSRNYGVFRPRYAVPSGVDPQQVLEAMRETSAALRANPKYSAAFMGDLHNLGIEEINAGSVIVSGTLRTAPLRQSELARAFNGGFLEALAKKDIVL
jgi:small-conductance mechanosensitive channel